MSYSLARDEDGMPSLYRDGRWEGLIVEWQHHRRRLRKREAYALHIQGPDRPSQVLLIDLNCDMTATEDFLINEIPALRRS